LFLAHISTCGLLYRKAETHIGGQWREVRGKKRGKREDGCKVKPILEAIRREVREVFRKRIV
jgi:hypothetical protein